LLLNQVIYTGWSSHCDIEPYTAWVIAYNESTLNQVSILDLTPNGHEGSVWMSGAGMAADSAGNIYLLMANGTFDTTLDANGFPSQGDYGNAFVKLSTADNGLAAADYFTMSNTVAESNADADLGSGGALLLPDMTDGNGVTRHLAVGAGKDQAIYLVDRDNMGKFNPAGDNIYQELLSALPGGIWSMPAYFNGRLYFGPVGNNLLAFQFANAQLGTSPVSQTTTTFVYPGATPSISADGTLNGIVWATENTDPAVLHAYDATDLSQELYNSNQAGTRDQFGTGNKFITPMIANGKVYVGTTNGVGVFGLLSAEATVSPTSLSFGGELVGASSSAQTVTLANQGQAALAITTIAASGDFAETNDCGASLPAGANCTISVTFKPTTGGARSGTLTITDNASGGPQTVTLSGTGEDFTLSVGSGGSASATVSPGQSAMYTLSVSGEGGFSQNVNFTCTGAPTAAACTVSPGSLTPGGSASNITVTVTSTAPSFSAPRTEPLPPILPLLSGPAGMVMLALLLGTLAWRIRCRRRFGESRVRAAFLILPALLILAMAMAGCGGGTGGGGSGTPAGTYTLTVTGSTSTGSTTLQHSINLSLTVS
jgi:hypothetical protein